MDENTVRYFQVLNLEPTASAEEIYQAYRDMARVWDPQRFSHSPRLEMKAEEKLREIIEAYHALQPGGFHGTPPGNAGDGESEGQRVPVSQPPDPFAAPGPGSKQIADLHRPTAWARTTPPQTVAPTTDTPRVIADLHRPLDLVHPVEAQRPRPVIVEPGAPTAPPPVLPAEPSAISSGAPVAVAPPLPPSATATFTGPPPGPQTTQSMTGTFAPLPQQAGPSSTGMFPPLPGQPSMSATSTFSGLPPVEAAALPEEPPKPKSKAVTLAVAGGTALVVVAGGLFLFEAMRTPNSSRPTTTSSSVATLPLEAPAPEASARDTAPAAESAAVQPEEEEREAAPVPRRSRKAKPQTEEAPRQLATGTELMSPMGRTGAGRFRVVNNSGQDAVARVSNHSSPESALRLVYVQNGTEVTIGNIGPGMYVVSFSMGPLTSKPRGFGARYGPFQFIQVDSVTGAQSDQYQITLKPKQ